MLHAVFPRVMQEFAKQHIVGPNFPPMEYFNKYDEDSRLRGKPQKKSDTRSYCMYYFEIAEGQVNLLTLLGTLYRYCSTLKPDMRINSV